MTIQAEEITILQEKERYGQQDKSVVPSLRAAEIDFSVIKNSIETVRDPEKYQAAAATYHARRKTLGVVTDGCHEAMNGHITRLGNRMSAVGISVPEKNILRQRQTNMRIVKELYIELQREALGIAAPAHEKGVER